MREGIEAAHYVARVSAIPTFAVTALLLGLGAMTLERERRSPEARAFFAVTLASAAWMFGFSWMNLSEDAGTAYRWFRVACLGVAFIAPAMYGFAVRVLGIEDRRRSLVRVGWGYFAACAALLLATDVLVDGVRPAPWGYYPDFRPASAVFVAPFLGLIGLTLWELWEAWRSAEPGTPRLRAGAFLAAFLVGSLAVVDLLPAYGVPIYPLGFAAVVGFVVLAGAAIWRYRLNDLEPAFAAEELVRTTSELVALCDREGRIRYANPALCTLTGLEPAELVGRPVQELVPPESSSAALESALGRSRITSWDLAFQGRDGAAVPVSLSSCELRDEHDWRVGTALLARDVRVERRTREALARVVFYDPVTGLANRALLLDRIRQARTGAQRGGERSALLCMQLDRYGRVIEGLGRAAGDELVAAVARRVAAAAPEADTVARSGEGQFAVLLRRVEREHEASDAARRILEALEPPVTVERRAVFPSAAVGIAVGGGERRDAEEMLEDAHAASLRARGRERRRIQLFADAMRRETTSSLELEADLRRAIDRDELLLHYQPIARVADLEVMGFEALLRWRHPEHGLMGPARFLSAARSARLLPRIGWWVLAQACRQMAAWRERHPSTRSLRLHVNLAAEELTHPRLLERLEAVLAEHELEPGCLTLEVTESTLLQETEEAIGIVDALRARGLRLCADDFGTGYSSLSYLGQFALDMLKIDATLVRDIPARADAKSILRAILDLARSLGIVAVAEGIEKPAQLRELRQGGCGLGQGFLLCRPLPAGEVDRRLGAGEALVRARPAPQSVK